MDIILSNSSDKPIYEQISSQVKAQILSGTLAAGAKLPSIRALASDLGVSVITTKRAYADLEQLGFICTVQGKGCFVAEGNQELLRENQLCHIEELLAKAANQAEALGVTRDKLHEMLDLVAPETTASSQPRVSGSSSRNVSQAKSSASRTTSVISPIRSVTKTAREAPAPRAARITVSSMPLTMPTSCIPIYSSSSSSSENRSRRLTNRPSLPSRAVMTTRAMASEIS